MKSKHAHRSHRSLAEIGPKLSDGFDKIEEKLEALKERMEASEATIGKDARQAAKFAEHYKKEPSSFAQVRPGPDAIKRSFAKVSEQLSALRTKIHQSTVEDEKEDDEDKQEVAALEKRHKESLAESFAEVDGPLGPGPTFPPPKLSANDAHALDQLEARLAKDHQIDDDMRAGKFDDIHPDESDKPSSFAQISP